MSQKTKAYFLAGLVALLVVVYFMNRSGSISGVVSVAPDAKFEPLKVEDPALRVYELDKVRKAEYKGADHNIFVYGPPRPTPEQIKAKAAEEHRRAFVGPLQPPPPPPLTVPATFFGYATNPKTKNRLAFFSTTDDVFIVGEGGVLLNRYRLMHIGNVSADFEEVSSGKHATLQMSQPNETPGAQQPQPSPGDAQPQTQ